MPFRILWFITLYILRFTTVFFWFFFSFSFFLYMFFFYVLPPDYPPPPTHSYTRTLALFNANLPIWFFFRFMLYSCKLNNTSFVSPPLRLEIFVYVLDTGTLLLPDLNFLIFKFDALAGIQVLSSCYSSLIVKYFSHFLCGWGIIIGGSYYMWYW